MFATVVIQVIIHTGNIQFIGCMEGLTCRVGDFCVLADLNV